MELKIRIKEVKEEARKLTIEEWAVYLLSKNGNSIHQHEAEDIVKSWGLIEFENDLMGHFRTETIRDATDNEIRAWHCLRIVEKCYDSCAGRIKNRNHVSCTTFSDEIQANGLLFNNEVILELVDE